MYKFLETPRQPWGLTGVTVSDFAMAEQLVKAGLSREQGWFAMKLLAGLLTAVFAIACCVACGTSNTNNCNSRVGGVTNCGNGDSSVGGQARGSAASGLPFSASQSDTPTSAASESESAPEWVKGGRGNRP